MKVIHLPVNISSQVSATVRALRSLGVEACGLVRTFSPIQDPAGVETIDWSRKLNQVPRLWRGIRWRWKMVRALAWADVVHWHWGDSTWKQVDLRLAASLGKPRLVEFWGDDIREPSLASRDNPFLARMYHQHPELANQRSRTVQQMFSRHGFACLIPGCELADYVDPALFDGFYQTRPRVLLDDLPAKIPDPKQGLPVLVHAPSDKARKGTEAVLAAINKLQKTHRFDFKLIHQMPRKQALATVAAADVFLDQFTIGAEGLAALEAMALGKPVVCFIKESLRSRYPAEFPVVMADQDSLAATLAGLIDNGPKRRELGLQGRKYVERYHDARSVAAELIEIYRDVCQRCGSKPSQNRESSSMHWHLLQPEKKELHSCVP
jgi:glycosyltransferase involved in cell wall biosynthesis